MVMMPGTQPRTERDQDCAIIARHTWSPQSNHAHFCHDIVRREISWAWSAGGEVSSGAGIGHAENRGFTFVDKRRDGIDRGLSIAGYVVDLSIVDLLLLSIDIIWARHIFRSRRSKKRDGTKRSAGGSGRNAGKGDQQHYNFLDHFTFPELFRLALYFG